MSEAVAQYVVTYDNRERTVVYATAYTDGQRAEMMHECRERYGNARSCDAVVAWAGDLHG